jgi:hypothetical protein
MDRFNWVNNINSKVVVNELPYKDDEYIDLVNIFENVVNRSKYNKQNYTKISKIFGYFRKIQPTENEIYIRDLAYQYLESVGMKQNKHVFMVECWRHRLFGDKKTYHLFSIHRDSNGALIVPVNTCIFYLRKDKTFKGGDLEIWGKIRLVSKPLKTIEISNKIVLFDGDILHKVLPFSGFGIRDCIVVQFAKF